MKQIKIDRLTWTQVPNVILDNLPEFTDAELRFVLATLRQTFGWYENGIQRQSHKMSVSFLMQATGMSHQGVINAYNRLAERGTISRVQDGGSFRYSLVVNGVDGGSTALIGDINGVDGKVVNGVDTNKERIKTKKERLPKLTDEEFLKGLKTNSAYSHINVEVELGRAQAWCSVNRRHCTHRFFINWLNRIDKPMKQAYKPTTIQSGHVQSHKGGNL